MACVIEAVGKLESGVISGRPLPQAEPGGGAWRPAIKIEERAIDWSSDATEIVLRKLYAASGQPGIPDTILGLSGRLHDPARPMRAGRTSMPSMMSRARCCSRPTSL